MEARLIIHGADAGPRNMAIDEALLVSVAQTGVPCLRFYAWTPATLSLGYFQRYEERQTHAASLAVPAVRRSTGGGAIVHDREITYAFVIPAKERSTDESLRLYLAFHETARQVLRHHGIDSRLWDKPARTPHKEPFLCFLRRSPGDLVAGPHKILGSAQRRHRGALLQHGSLILERSPCAPEIPGLPNSHIPFEGGHNPIRTQWIRYLAERLNLSWREGELTQDEWHHAERLAETKFANSAWTHKR